ncbi:MAG: permease [Desulfitobacterium sp.]
MKTLKKFKWTIILLFIVDGLYLYNKSIGINAFNISFSNLKEMLLLVPPIFVIMGLLDVWVPKETFMKYMGHGSGITGLGIALVLGTAAAGPLYVAFPIGLLLLKKGARLAYVIFFLGVWASTKLPIVLFEIASLGFKFTMIHIGISLPLYLLIAYIIEKTVSNEEISLIISKAESV